MCLIDQRSTFFVRFFAALNAICATLLISCSVYTGIHQLASVPSSLNVFVSKIYTADKFSVDDKICSSDYILFFDR